MDILITNDDGFMAQGIGEMFQALSTKHQVTMVAPDRERSSCGHAITLTKALRLKMLEKNKYNCTGFPADCVLLGLGQVYAQKAPDLVISGINHGANLGQDRFYSGTIAAAREAAFRGMRGVAISLVTANLDKALDFSFACEYLHKILDQNVQEKIPEGTFININVPNIPKSRIKGAKLTKTGVQIYTEDIIEREDFRGSKYYWLGGRYNGYELIEGSDCEAVYDGHVAVSFHPMHPSGPKADLQELERIINCI